MFTEDLWNEWSLYESQNYLIEDEKKTYLKKGYTHFDHRFWFPDRKDELKTLLKNGLKETNTATRKMQWHPFTPFIKLLLKTPRYRYQEEEGAYELESKIRPICFASHLDSLIFGFYSFGLNKKYQQYIKDNHFDECVLAYRSDTGKSNIQHSKEVFDQVKTFNHIHGGCTAIALDIKGYFDNINHAVLKDKWAKVWGSRLAEDQFHLFQILTEYSYVSKKNLLKKLNIDERELKSKKQFPSTLFELVPGTTIQYKYDWLKSNRLIPKNKISKKKPLPAGVPQGSAISALLSNIYLIDYDKTMMAIAKSQGFIYRRYCDDILFICETSMANDIKNFAIKEIKQQYYLTIQKAKAEVIDFKPDCKGKIRGFRRRKNNPTAAIVPSVKNEKALYKNLQYLGFEFNGQTTFVRSSSLSRYFRKMKAKLDKTVAMAYSSKSRGKHIFKNQVFEKYSHLGTQNFIAYAMKSSQKTYPAKDGQLKEGHNSSAIRKQLTRHVEIINDALKIKNKRRFRLKIYKGEKLQLKI